MPWSWGNKAQEGEFTAANGERRVIRHEVRGVKKLSALFSAFL
jgi:hypothetical protein